MIKSSYLNKEINLKTGTASGPGGRKNIIVFHHELEHFIQEVLPNEGIEVYYDFIVCSTTPDDIVVKCDMWHGSKRRVVTLGEATPSTLNSSIEKAFPTTMASHRAFDRAAIRFLGLGPHVYSNMEMDPDGPVTTPHHNLVDVTPSNTVSEDVETVDQSTATKAPESEQHIQSEPKTETAVKHQSEKTAQCVNASQSTPEQSSEKRGAASKPASNSVDADGAVKITFGKYTKDSKTVAEIFATDRSWLEYVTKNINPKNEEFVKQLAAGRRYIAAHSK